MRAREKRKGRGREIETKVEIAGARGVWGAINTETRDVTEAMIAIKMSTYMRHDGTPFGGAAMERSPNRYSGVNNWTTASWAMSTPSACMA